MRGRLFLSGLFALTLAGCAAGQNTYPDVATPGMPNVQAALNHAILRTDEAVAQLDGGPVAQAAATPLPAVYPAELEKPISWSYRGELAAGVRALAQSVGYQVKVVRPSGSKRVEVAVNIADLPIIDAFHALSTEAGSAATVNMDPAQHLVEVTYASVPTTKA